MRGLGKGLLWLGLVCLSGSACAVRVSSIFQDDVPVASFNKQDKARALPIALTHVFIKVSGNNQILDVSPQLKAALAKADTLVQSTSYTTPAGAAKVTPYLLTIHFDPDAVKRLLQDAGVGIWQQNRPLILVWLALPGDDQALAIADNAAPAEKLFQQTAKERGLPLIFPMMDVTDIIHVTLNDITTQASVILQQASRRYDSNALLIGTVQPEQKALTSHWQLVLGADAWEWTVSGASLADVFHGIVANVTDVLAARYVAATPSDIVTEVTLNVAGVKHNTDLVNLMTLLQHLPTVAEVQLRGVAGNLITLEVSLRNSRVAFLQATATTKKLRLENPTNPVDGSVDYTWIP